MQESDHPLKEQHQLINFFLSQLNKEQRRWFTAIEAKRQDNNNRAVSKITGICHTTISRGRKELDEWLVSGSISRNTSRRGKYKIEIVYPNIKTTLEALINNEIAGDPMTEVKWVRSSSRQLAKKLEELGYTINYCTVIRLLKEMGFSLKTNKKTKSRLENPQRDEQFKYIAQQKNNFVSNQLPVISVDTKKKELIGNFKKDGRTWCKEAEEVYKYDFTSLADCRAVPYGIYDVEKNKGYVFVGTSGDTPEFAIDAIVRWWELEGNISYPLAKQLLILADGGGSNGYKVRAWKKQIQEKLCDELQLIVTVCHYPPGCSKWNPIEHRLFSQISINWAGKPLKSLDIMLGYIRGTNTRTGLKVKAFLHKGSYQRGQKVTKEEMAQLNLYPHTVCSQWNYTIMPRPNIC
ncbi:MAG: ISAzo13 family transposase [Acidobacteria bacterium]|nr:ISAzo13 family transposase [Acidobacteriota bacterium]